MTQIITLENLSCQHCVKRVTDSFLSLPDVSEVTVDLEHQQAIVNTNRTYSPEEYQATLAKTIYKVIAVD